MGSSWILPTSKVKSTPTSLTPTGSSVPVLRNITQKLFSPPFSLASVLVIVMVKSFVRLEATVVSVAGTVACLARSNSARTNGPTVISTQVFGSDLASVSLGDSAEVLTGIGSTSFSGRVDNISALVDPDTRSVPVRVVVENPGDFLKKQMYVRVLIQARQESTGLLVPVSAVLRDDENLPFVYRRPARRQLRAAARDPRLSRRGPIRYRRRSQGRRPDRGRRGHLCSVHADSMSEPLPPTGSAPRKRVDHEPDRGLLAAAALSRRPHDAACSSARDRARCERLPVDAYPDLSPPMVEIITQWPGHAAEEVERLITVPVEMEMNGIPRMTDDPLDLALRIVRRHPHFRNRHRQLLRPPAGLQSAGRPQSAERRDALGGAAVRAFGSDLSLRAAEPRPLADGAQDLRGLDRRTAIQIRSRRGGRFRVWRRHHAVPGAARSGQGRLGRPVGAAGGERPDRQQRQLPAAASIRRAASSITCAAWGA